MAAADRYAEVLTDADVATLKHLADTGMGANTLRALASDLAYLEAWSLAATGGPLSWPADPELILKFIAHHLWDPNQKAVDPAHGMPDAVIDELWDRKVLKVRWTARSQDRIPAPGQLVDPAPVERRRRPVR